VDGSDALLRPRALHEVLVRAQLGELGGHTAS
jgi:hypothetical protein